MLGKIKHNMPRKAKHIRDDIELVHVACTKLQGKYQTRLVSHLYDGGQQLWQRGRSFGCEFRAEAVLERGLEQAAAVVHAEVRKVKSLGETARKTRVSLHQPVDVVNIAGHHRHQVAFVLVVRQALD